MTHVHRNGSTRGYFAIGIEYPVAAGNVGGLWRSAHIFGATFCFTVGHRYSRQPQDTTASARHVPLFTFDSLSELVIPEDAALIGVELLDEAHDLLTYEHPERAVYLLGAEDAGLSDEALARCDEHIVIPTAVSLNVAVAGSIVLYDRLAKARRPVECAL